MTGIRCAAGALCALLVCASGCSGSHASDSSTGVQIQVRESVPLQIGNLVQRVLRPGSRATALCYVAEDRVPPGFPGSAIRVRSGRTVGYTVVEVDGHPVYDPSGQELRQALPDCPDVALQ